jgi:UDP:flavonoid glycosyltransferase YjiC (YdhE family)
MVRFLSATQPVTGHVVPALPIVHTLVERGNEVVWYTGKKFRSQVEATGARFAPYQEAYDYDDDDFDAAFPGRSQLAGLSQIKFDFINVFIKQIGPQHHDIEALLNEFPADVIVGDPSVFAPFSVNERGGPPNAVYNVSCLGIKGHDVAPPEQVRKVVTTVLSDPRYRKKARQIQAEIASHDAPRGGPPSCWRSWPRRRNPCQPSGRQLTSLMSVTR